MCELENSATPPNSEDIQYALESAKQLQEEVVNYRDGAQKIDDRFTRENEDRRISLDDLPYGEELISTRDLPGQLCNTIKTLEKISEDQSPSANVAQIFEGALECVKEVRSKLDNCKPLPPEEKDEDDS